MKVLKTNFGVALRSSGSVAFILMAVVFANAQYKGAKPVPVKWSKGFRSVTIPYAKNILEFIAGPDFLGRSPSQPGFAAAAGFVAGYLRQNGLKPAGSENSFFQRFTMIEVRTVPDGAVMASSDGSIKFEWGKDYTLRAAADLDAMGQFVFLRIAKGDDLSKVDLAPLKGKIVVLAQETPPNRDATVKLNALNSTDQRPLWYATVVRTGTPLGEVQGLTRIKDVIPENRPPTLRITDTAVAKIAEACGAKNYLDATTTTTKIEMCDKDFVFKAKTTSRDLYETMNVVAKIEGSDPVLKNEAVFIGAHLDHLGVRNNAVFNGADDDGSGTTAVMLIARALMQNKVRPKRTIILAFWCGEELGTIGSRNYVNHPTFPLDKVISYLNLDMVGRNEEDKRFNEKPEKNTTSIYTGSVKFNSEDLYNRLYKANAYVNLRLKDDHEERVLRTDTANFYTRGIPTLKTFGGEHLDYHKATDTVDKINFEKLTNVAKWIYLTVMELSTNPTKPRFERKPFVAAPNPVD